MNDFIKFTDAVTGTVTLPGGFNGKQYLKTKDSKSKSGHSLVTQIEMTHAGIVTRNLGFYLPDNMKKGAPTFNKHYNKPVLIGHDDDSDPVGRVVDANYIDTSASLRINDKYLSSLYEFVDKKKSGGKEGITDFVQYVVQEYSGKDSYRGLGHILGSLKIEDEETIAKILDNRYLTVSTSMTSDAARCSECGTDWISEGQCEHERGQVYDSGVPVMLIPGSQAYGHLGIVTEPADVFAAGFKGIEIIKDGKIEDLKNDNDLAFTDNFSIAANLFSYQDSRLISLSDKKETDLIEVKNNIQRIEDSLNKTEKRVMTGKDFADNIEATISLWTNDEGESTSVRISKYVKELSSDDLSELSKKAMAALDSKEFENEAEFTDALRAFVLELAPEVVEDSTEEPTGEEANDEMKVVKVLNDKFKLVDGTEYAVKSEEEILDSILELKDADVSKREAKELAKLIVRSQHDDAIATLTIQAKDKKVEDCVTEFKAIKDKRFKLGETSEEEILSKMNELLEEDSKISEDAFKEMDSKACAGSRKYFPITSAETAKAAREVLGLAKAADSLKGRILVNIEKIADSFEVSEPSSTENFDTSNGVGDNQLELSDKELLENCNELIKSVDERGLLEEVLAVHLDEKQQEIEILEQQLDLANDHVEKLEGELSDFKDKAKVELAEKVVDAKIGSGLFGIEDREKEVEKHLERTEDSLRDAAKDFEGVGKAPAKPAPKKIESPVLEDAAKTANEQLVSDSNDEEAEKARALKVRKDNSQRYNLLKAQKGKKFADNWLRKQL